jgi:hypothetical protein
VYDPYGDTWRTWTWKDKAGWAEWGWLVREYEMSPDDFEKTGMLWAQRRALMSISTRSWAVAAMRLEGTLVYQTPVLNAQAIKADPNKAVVGREVMETYESSNRWATKLFLTDSSFARHWAGERGIGVFEENRDWAHRRWTTRVCGPVTWPPISREVGGLEAKKKSPPAAEAARGDNSGQR